MKAEALRGSRLSAEQIDGAVLAQTLLVPDDHHARGELLPYAVSATPTTRPDEVEPSSGTSQ